MAKQPKTGTTPRDWAEIRHFKPTDFSCKCERCRGSGVVPISMDLVKRLDRICEAIGLPVTVQFGVRCQAAQNRRKGGPSWSPHVPHGDDGVGTAADILCPDKKYRYKIIAAAILAGIDAIGIGPNFVHLEINHREGVQVCWLYGR